MNDLVSVVIPNYNREFSILETIDSVFSQTYRPIELIVIDDHSTDDSLKIVKEYLESICEDGFSIQIALNEGKYAGAARNYGYKISSGKYIQFLDSDDILLPQKISSELSLMKSSGSSIIYSKAQFIKGARENLMQEYWGRKLTNGSEDYFEFPWQTMCALYSREVLMKYGGWNSKLSLNDDWEMSLRYLINCRNEISFLDQVNSLYRDHDGDRVGNNLTVKKLDSLYLSLTLTKKLLIQSDLFDEYLSSRFDSRLLYCAFQFGRMGEIKKKNEVLKMHISKKIYRVVFSFINVRSVFSFLLKRRVDNKYIVE